jgi:hypothetical protein
MKEKLEHRGLDWTYEIESYYQISRQHSVVTYYLSVYNRDNNKVISFGSPAKGCLNLEFVKQQIDEYLLKIRKEKLITLKNNDIN